MSVGFVLGCNLLQRTATVTVSICWQQRSYDTTFNPLQSPATSFSILRILWGYTRGGSSPLSRTMISNAFFVVISMGPGLTTVVARSELLPTTPVVLGIEAPTPPRESTTVNRNEILINLSESPTTKVGKEEFEQQSVPQKVFSAIWEVESEINNGGFSQYFLNEVRSPYLSLRTL
jgi:Domain of unknown function (DUF4375)